MIHQLPIAPALATHGISNTYLGLSATYYYAAIVPAFLTTPRPNGLRGSVVSRAAHQLSATIEQMLDVRFWMLDVGWLIEIRTIAGVPACDSMLLVININHILHNIICESAAMIYSCLCLH